MYFIRDVFTQIAITTRVVADHRLAGRELFDQRSRLPLGVGLPEVDEYIGLDLKRIQLGIADRTAKLDAMTEIAVGAQAPQILIIFGRGATAENEPGFLPESLRVAEDAQDPVDTLARRHMTERSKNDFPTRFPANLVEGFDHVFGRHTFEIVWIPRHENRTGEVRFQLVLEEFRMHHTRRREPGKHLEHRKRGHRRRIPPAAHTSRITQRTGMTRPHAVLSVQRRQQPIVQIGFLFTIEQVVDDPVLHHEIVQHDDTRQPLQALEDRVVVLFIVAQVVNYRVELPGDRLHVHIVFDDTNADVFNLVRLM
ncbi:Uncharacterised protein [Burkholderia pseudomallei]|nr:Uncharacterised protein [Burkholderia pseudomallei]